MRAFISEGGNSNQRRENQHELLSRASRRVAGLGTSGGLRSTVLFFCHASLAHGATGGLWEAPMPRPNMKTKQRKKLWEASEPFLSDEP
jgi:hypothetical protein